MCELLIEHMSNGYSFEAFGGVVRVSRQTLYTWVGKYKEFAEAKEIGFNSWLLYIESILLSKTTGKKMAEGVDPRAIDIAGAIFMLKTRGSSIYYEKKEIEIDAEEKITVIVK